MTPEQIEKLYLMKDVCDKGKTHRLLKKAVYDKDTKSLDLKLSKSFSFSEDECNRSQIILDPDFKKIKRKLENVATQDCECCH